MNGFGLLINRTLLQQHQIQITKLLLCIQLFKNKKMAMNLVKKMQIKVQSKDQSGAKIEALIFDKAPTTIPIEYFDYSNIILAIFIMQLPEYTGMNNHIIKLKKDKQPFFGPIYNLGPIELETLKTYIEINLANGFIYPSKSFTGALILFNQKPDVSFYLCVNYQDLNNFKI